MISFQEDSTSIIDQWMAQEGQVADVSASTTTSTNKALSNIPAITSDQRLGLGFKPSSAAKKDVNTANADKLKAILDKKQKRKQDELEKHEYRDLHGVVEDQDLEEESKVAILSKMAQKQQQKTTPAKNNNHNHGNNQPANKKQKTEAAPNSNNNNNTQPQTQAKATPTKSNNSNANNNHNKPQTPSDKSITSNNSNIEADGDEQQQKRKRKKTRYKQKNIRKDNRSDTQKPDHLKIGSLEYKGRPITAETKKILGINHNKRNKKQNQH